MELGAHFLESSIFVFERHKRLCERAIGQLTNAQLHEVIAEDGNSIVVQMKHMAGNMRSRWTDFLTTDGEKKSRMRDGEFIDDFESREQLDAYWEGGWQVFLDTMRSLTPEDLMKEVTVRGEPHTVVEAIQRQIAHYAYHTGQIVQQARNLKGHDWQSLSIARGESDAWNAKMGFTPQ